MLFQLMWHEGLSDLKEELSHVTGGRAFQAEEMARE